MSCFIFGQQEEICRAAGRGMVEGEPREGVQEIQPSK